MDVAAGLKLAAEGKAAHVVHFKHHGRMMTLYKGDEALAARQYVASKLDASIISKNQKAQQQAQQERRAAFAEEQRRVEREAQAAAWRERHANFDDEQLCMQRDRCAAANRARRGVTPLYNALQLPVGQREDQLLCDVETRVRRIHHLRH